MRKADATTRYYSKFPNFSRAVVRCTVSGQADPVAQPKTLKRGPSRGGYGALRANREACHSDVGGGVVAVTEPRQALGESVNATRKQRQRNGTARLHPASSGLEMEWVRT